MTAVAQQSPGPSDVGSPSEVGAASSEGRWPVAIPSLYDDEESGIRFSSFVPSLSVPLLRGFVKRLTRTDLFGELPPVVVLYGLGSAAGFGPRCRRVLRRLIGTIEGRNGIDVTTLGWLSLGVALLVDRRTNDDLVDTSDGTDR